MIAQAQTWYSGSEIFYDMANSAQDKTPYYDVTQPSKDARSRWRPQPLLAHSAAAVWWELSVVWMTLLSRHTQSDEFHEHPEVLLQQQ